MKEPIKIVYVLGSDRSGGALVDNTIARRSGIMQLGEVRLWPDFYTDDHLCSCGQRKTECDFWAPVIQNLSDFDRAHKNFESTKKPLFRFYLVLPSRLKKLFFRRVSGSFYELYDEIRSIHGRDLMLDRSKSPAYGAALSQINGLDVVFVHIIRHPLGVIYSWKRHNESIGHSTTNGSKSSLLKVAVKWNVTNLLCEIAKLRNPLKSINIQYEDLGNPSLQELLMNQMELMKAGESQKPQNHLMFGEIGADFIEAEFELNEEWRMGLSTFEKLLYGVITYPLYLFYLRKEKP